MCLFPLCVALCDHNPPMWQTDRQTDRVCDIVHCRVICMSLHAMCTCHVTLWITWYHVTFRCATNAKNTKNKLHTGKQHLSLNFQFPRNLLIALANVTRNLEVANMLQGCRTCYEEAAAVALSEKVRDMCAGQVLVELRSVISRVFDYDDDDDD